MDMKTVWKFEIDPRAEVCKVKMPIGSKPLSVQLQFESAQLWCLCNPQERLYEERHFVLVGTGERFTSDIVNYIGTFQVQGGAFIWHLFEVQPVAITDSASN